MDYENINDLTNGQLLGIYNDTIEGPAELLAVKCPSTMPVWIPQGVSGCRSSAGCCCMAGSTVNCRGN